MPDVIRCEDLWITDMQIRKHENMQLYRTVQMHKVQYNKMFQKCFEIKYRNKIHGKIGRRIYTYFKNSDR